MTIKIRILVVLMVCFLLPQFAYSQNRLRGVVTDSEGAVISGAHVFIHWDASGSKVGLTTNIGIKEDRALISDAKGRFSTELPPGFYDVFVSAPVFSPDCRKVRIIKGSAADYNPRLKVSALITKELGDTFSSPSK
jgi:hypothetical protein